ncbi:MAG: hypothetical protein SFU53_13160 [Terrimicrobiaceae bacterium]|nr:hypothetical protein [Terrimicrobiaceae bacterium]
MEELTWDDAFVRVEDYLRTHGVEPRERLLRLTLALIEEAREHHRSNPAVSPLETAMRLTEERVDRWFENLAGSVEAVPRARVAFFASGRTGLFLCDELPDDFVRSVRNAAIQAGPALEFQSLARREVDYGPMEDIARETWDRFSWAHVLKAFLFWLVVFVLSWGAYLRFFR